MKMSIIIPVLGQIHEVKGIVNLILALATSDYETVIINNTVDPKEREEWNQFIQTYLRPKNLVYIENPDNLGMVQTLQQGYEESTGDILAYLHSDLFIYKEGWDQTVIDVFESNPEIGLAGFFGQKGMYPNAGRYDCMSNMMEAEIHGRRMIVPLEYVVATDGFSMICKREMLDKGNGFDMDFRFHHVYDKNIGMDSLHRGYKNVCINIPVHHWSGKTANSAQYQDWINKQMGTNTGDQDTMAINLDIFDRKWGNCLPIFVDDAGNISREIVKNGIQV